MIMGTVDKNFYPGWVRKAITFTIDDGNIPLDKKFIDTVKPGGILGTFNISSPKLNEYTPEFYREFYRGYGISNHCKLHPRVRTEKTALELADGIFDPATADKTKLHRTEREGLYKYFANNSYWANMADAETYCRLADEGRADIEAVFGEGSVTTFVWPYCEQDCEYVKDYIINKAGYIAVRKTGALRDTTGFSLPADRWRWSYNAGHTDLLDVAEKYEAYPDDGQLKFFCFGLHSHDYERGNCWDRLEAFVERFGSRPDTYYYATVEDIFKYEDAVKAVTVTENSVTNPSDIPVFVKINGNPTVLAAGSTLEFS